MLYVKYFLTFMPVCDSQSYILPLLNNSLDNRSCVTKTLVLKVFLNMASAPSREGTLIYLLFTPSVGISHSTSGNKQAL